MSLNFDYLKPPAIVQPAEIEPVETQAEQAPPPMTRREKRQATPWNERTHRARSFAKTRLKNELRPVLMMIDPFCHCCRRPLQESDSSDAETFARVMLAEKKLACEACVNAIEHAKREVGKTERLKERVAEFLRGQ